VPDETATGNRSTLARMPVVQSHGPLVRFFELMPLRAPVLLVHGSLLLR